MLPPHDPSVAAVAHLPLASSTAPRPEDAVAVRVAHAARASDGASREDFWFLNAGADDELVTEPFALFGRSGTATLRGRSAFASCNDATDGKRLTVHVTDATYFEFLGHVVELPAPYTGTIIAVESADEAPFAARNAFLAAEGTQPPAGFEAYPNRGFETWLKVELGDARTRWYPIASHAVEDGVPDAALELLQSRGVRVRRALGKHVHPLATVEEAGEFAH